LNRNPKIRDYISERVEGMSFEEIYSKYVDAVYRFLKFKLGDEHLVEDFFNIFTFKNNYCCMLMFIKIYLTKYS
jgi:hypothetical protein